MKTVAEANQINLGQGRVLLQLDWRVRLPERRAKELQRHLRNIDHDAGVLTVFSDGVRCLDGQSQSHYWRKPLATLTDVIAMCAEHGVEHGRGFWLPTGWNCHCTRFAEDEICQIGADISCMPEPSRIDDVYWFGW